MISAVDVGAVAEVPAGDETVNLLIGYVLTAADHADHRLGAAALQDQFPDRKVLLHLLPHGLREAEEDLVYPVLQAAVDVGDVLIHHQGAHADAGGSEFRDLGGCGPFGGVMLSDHHRGGGDEGKPGCKAQDPAWGEGGAHCWFLGCSG